MQRHVAVKGSDGREAAGCHAAKNNSVDMEGPAWVDREHVGCTPQGSGVSLFSLPKHFLTVCTAARTRAGGRQAAYVLCTL